MIDDIIEIAPETREGSVNGHKVMFRAYISADRTERLVWKVDDSTGNDAMLDKINGVVTLPTGREVEQDGRMTHYLDIPRWLADALMNDFDEFEEESVDPLTKSDSASNGDSPDKDDNEGGITPIFDSADREDDAADSNEE